MSLEPSDPALAGTKLDKPGTPDLNVLVLNTDLPVFPGAGGHEFLSTTNLAAWAGHVGLVSMAHTREDLNRSQALADAGVRLYLWHSPWLDGPPAGPARRGLVRTLHGWGRRLVEAARARRGFPSDTRIMD